MIFFSIFFNCFIKKLKNKLSDTFIIIYYHIVLTYLISSMLPEQVCNELGDFLGWKYEETANIITLTDPVVNGLIYRFTFEYGYPYPEKSPLVHISGNIPERPSF